MRFFLRLSVALFFSDRPFFFLKGSFARRSFFCSSVFFSALDLHMPTTRCSLFAVGFPPITVVFRCSALVSRFKVLVFFVARCPFLNTCCILHDIPYSLRKTHLSILALFLFAQ